jgi:hypothetical protein
MTKSPQGIRCEIGDPELLMQAARKAPEIQKMMADKYDAHREEFLAQFDKAAEMNENIGFFRGITSAFQRRSMITPMETGLWTVQL